MIDVYEVVHSFLTHILKSFMVFHGKTYLSYSIWHVADNFFFIEHHPLFILELFHIVQTLGHTLSQLTGLESTEQHNCHL